MKLFFNQVFFSATCYVVSITIIAEINIIIFIQLRFEIVMIVFLKRFFIYNNISKAINV